MTETNPLIHQAHLLDFAAIRAEHVSPALDVLLKDAADALKKATDPATAADWQHVIDPLDAALEKLSRAWGAVGHLMGVMDSPELRDAFNGNLPRMTQFYIDLSQNEALYGKYKAIAAGAGYAALSAQKKRLLEHEMRDFRLSGADLPADKKAELKACGEKAAALSQKFSENLLDATNAWTLDITDEKELEGIPSGDKALMAQTAKAAGVDGWRITLQYPIYLPVMKYAANRTLRETVYRAFVTRASEFGPKEKDNGPVIQQLLELRQKEAELLGFKNFAEVSLATKMAETPAEVIHFLRDLAARAKPWAQKDETELEAYAREKLALTDMQPWDQAWASEKLREERYSFSDEEVKQYFTLPAVFKGLFGLVERLFDIRITPDTAPVWHKDVRFWRISDAKGNLIAQFYTDLFARASKRGGAWMDNDLTACTLPDGTHRTPTAYLVCNFAEPVGDKPSLLTHDDVQTLFHEFGHGLHHMLSRVETAGLSGINGVEWDAVEMPSQFMENWAWQYDVIKTISAKDETGEPLPKALFDKMLAAKNFHAGLFCVRQLEFALFDMLLHGCGDGKADFMKVLSDVRKEVAVTPSVPFNRFPQSFSHIFAGGYAAGYYSYKWAEVLSADAFSAFEEEGLFNPAVGKRWLDEVISRGASRSAMENFVAFRGRKPTLDALMRHSGMQGTPA